MTRLRVRVENYPTPTTQWHESTGVQATLIEGTGAEAEATAEVQVVKRGPDLVVVIAGLYGYTVNDRGHLVVHVSPTHGQGSGMDTSPG